MTDATLFDFPYEPQLPLDGAARHSDPATSVQAATNRTNVLRWGSQRTRLLQAFAEVGPWGLTDEEAGLAAGVARVADTRRCSELRKSSLIRDTRTTRATTTGSDAMVCALTRDGLAALAHLEEVSA